MDVAFLERLCEQDLVFTDSMIVEIPIAFPISPQLASGFSSWMIQGTRYHAVSIQSSKDNYAQETCNTMFSGEDAEEGDYAQITIKNMFLPLVFFGSCVVLATIFQLIHCFKTKQGKKSLIGRQSSVDLMVEAESTNNNRITWIRRLCSDYDNEDDKEDEEDHLRLEEEMPQDKHQNIHNVRSIMAGSMGDSDELEEDMNLG